MPEATCPNCGAAFSHPEGMARGVCPRCQALLAFEDGQWTASPGDQPAPSGATLACPSCGETDDENRYKCVYCGEPLHPEAAAPAPTALDSTVETLIPYRNASALAAYYLGVFSLIPCVGVILAVLAVVFGVAGLKAAKAHPETKGRGHAIAGIVLGTLVLVGHLAGAIAIAIASNS